MTWNNINLLITDGWHPTINASSRMPIHHIRYNKELGSQKGILNELPRKNGGSTIRALRIDSEGNIRISSLNKPKKWMPWWIPCSSIRATEILSKQINAAIQNPLSNTSEAMQYARLMEEYSSIARINPNLTMGEALSNANNALYSEICSFTTPDLQSLTTHPLRSVLADALAEVDNRLYEVLDAVAAHYNKQDFGLLGILTAISTNEYRIIYETKSRRMVGVSLEEPYSMTYVTVNSLADALRLGKFLPGSQLLTIIEIQLAKNGYHITHFGNTYGKIPPSAKAMETDVDAISHWEDDQDSWNYAVLKGKNGVLYPIHLLDLLSVRPSLKKHINHLVKSSLMQHKTLEIEVNKGDDLYAAISHRGS